MKLKIKKNTNSNKKTKVNTGLQILSKHVAIDKINAQITIIIGVASFISVFCLVGSKYLLTDHSYLSKVSSATSIAKNQLQSDITNYDQLKDSYNKWTSNSTNILGGSSSTTGSGSNFGDNGQIVLDALPSEYYTPELYTYLNSLLGSSGAGFSLAVTNSVASSSTSTTSAATPYSVSFSLSNSSFNGFAALLQTLQNSIRPIQINQISLSGSESSLTVGITANMFYQSSITFSNSSTKVQQ